MSTANEVRNSREPRILRNWVSSTVVTLLVFLVAAIIWALVQQNRHLREVIANHSAAFDYIGPGDVMLDVAVTEVNGSPRALSDVIAEGGVIAFLTTTCRYCEATIPFWDQLGDYLGDRSIAFVGVSLHPREITQSYVGRHGIHWPLVSARNPSALSAIGISGVPVLLVVRPGGEVAEVWIGRRDTSEVDEVVTTIADHLRVSTAR